MDILIDSNLVYSALLKEGRISRLILHPNPLVTFFAPSYLLQEIERYWERIIFLSGLSGYHLQNSLDELLKNIVLLNDEEIEPGIFKEAERICASVDEKDTIFVAMSLYFNLHLWTGDKKLRKGLEKQGYFICISTNEIYRYLDSNPEN